MSKMFNRRRALQIGASLPLTGALFGAARAEEQPWADVGPYEVATVQQIDLVDPARGRKIPTRAYYPAKPGRYPGIIFSHGFGGSLKLFANNSPVWASHGYVVIHPTHVDSIGFPDPSVPAADAAAMREYQLEKGARKPATTAAFLKVLDDTFFVESHLADINYILGILKTGGPDNMAPVHERIDTSRMGMSGHSDGAYTTLVVAGAVLTPPLKTPVPSGFAAFMSLSGQGAGRMGFTDTSFGKITKPLMCITGTRDFGAAGETPPWRLQAFERSPPGHKYAVVVDGFAHPDFDPPVGDPVRGARGSVLRRLEVAFWNAALRGERAGYRDLDTFADASKSTDPVWLRRR